MDQAEKVHVENSRYPLNSSLFSRPYIHECEQREKISKELTDLWDYPKYGCPHREGKRYFFSKNSGLQNQR